MKNVMSDIKINKKVRINPSEIDLIITWPKNCDYPLWRKQLRKNRHRFNKVIVVFMETNQGFNYRDYVMEVMKPDVVTFLDSPMLLSGQDWRNVAVNLALDNSYADIVWFTEQDFYITKDRFWTEIYNKLMMGFDIVGITQGGRLHPACIFADRSVINKTKRLFSVIPEVGDHFIQFQKDVENMKIDRCYLADEEIYGYTHMNGLSHNWTLITRGELANYKPEIFYEYLNNCIISEKEIGLHPEYKNTAISAIKAYSRHNRG